MVQEFANARDMMEDPPQSVHFLFPVTRSLDRQPFILLIQKYPASYPEEHLYHWLNLQVQEIWAVQWLVSISNFKGR